MQTQWNYQLYDDGGLCTLWDQPMLIPVGTRFEHEYGSYTVEEHRTDALGIVEVICERL